MQKPSDGKYLNKGIADWVKGLTDKDPVARRAAVYALGEIGPAARTAVPKVRRLLKDKESFVRLWAADALGKIEPEKKRDAIATLKKGLQDPAAFARSLSATFLGALGASIDTRDVLPALERCLTDSDQSVRAEVALAIKRIQGKGARS